APSTEETKPFETDESAATPPPHRAYHGTARISIPAPVPTPVWSDVEVARLLAISTPPSSPPLLLPSASRREDRPGVTLPPQKRLGIALGLRYEVGESSSAAAARPAGGLRTDYGFVSTMDKEIKRDLEREVGYGITDSWDKIVETLQGAPVSTDTELGRHMTAFETRVRQDTDEIYTRLDDEQSGRQLLAGRRNMLFRDRRTHARTARLMKTEEIDGDYSDVDGRPKETEAVYRGTEADKETSDSDDRVRESTGTRQRSCTARYTRGGW
ncbi:hypothetical protein Tco_0063439, partial [Tanacetum coccineum]